MYLLARAKASKFSTSPKRLIELRERLPDAFMLQTSEATRRARFHYEQGNARIAAEEFARSCVRGGHASPDGELWLRDLVAHHPDAATLKAFDAEVVAVRRDGAQWQPTADFLKRMEATFA